MNQLLIKPNEPRLTLDDLIQALRQLTPAEREIVRHEVNKQTWQTQFRQILASIQAQMIESEMSEAEIEAEIEAARSERYARRH